VSVSAYRTRIVVSETTTPRRLYRYWP
jgi:hypothetical protein